MPASRRRPRARRRIDYRSQWRHGRCRHSARGAGHVAGGGSSSRGVSPVPGGRSGGQARLASGVMRRICIQLAYDGGPFHGWQGQPGLSTIQGLLEEIVSAMEGKPVDVAGSGRTDAGVHALAQVAAFNIENPIPLPNLRRAVNRLLPPAIRVLSTREVPADFHPRFDALSKTYEYRIVRGEVCSPFEWPYVYHHPYPLDEERMAAFARVFEGEHDFSAFAASDVRDSEGKSKVRTIFSSLLERGENGADRKSTRLNSSHRCIS